jgi:hypothetical protein
MHTDRYKDTDRYGENNSSTSAAFVYGNAN